MVYSVYMEATTEATKMAHYTDGMTEAQKAMIAAAKFAVNSGKHGAEQLAKGIDPFAKVAQSDDPYAYLGTIHYVGR